MLATGALSPLEGFMGREDYERVVEDLRLASGLPWALPVCLAVPAPPQGDRVALADGSGRLLAVLDVGEAYEYDREREAERCFRTTETDHPGVARLFGQHPFYLSGRVTVFDRVPPAFPELARDPADTRAAFAERGCANCHGAPGVTWEKFSEGLHPYPPDLKEVAGERTPQQLFWVIKNGINMTGMPAQNDSFSIARSRSEDMFTTLSTLAATLEASTATSGDRAKFNSDMATVLQQLDQAGDHLQSVRAEVGARLSTIDGAQDTLADRKVELETTTSQLRDLDYAEAVSRMNQQLVGLQAAQASYSKIAQLSLFDYLR